MNWRDSVVWWGWFLAAILFFVGLTVVIGQGELIMRLQKANAASADCAKWLDKAAHYVDAGFDTFPELSQAYSLLAIAHGCNR